MRRLLLPLTLLALLPAAASAGEWVAGDLHVHTTYSHDSYGGPEDDNTGPEEFYVAGHSVGSQFTVAQTRGLDFLAITDHLDLRSQTDDGFNSGGVLGIPAYENSLKGHAQMLGARKIYPSGDKGSADVRAMADALRADGGAFQANHPIDPTFEYDDVAVDSVEVWNLPWYYQSPLPSGGNDHDRSLDYWYARLDRGEKPAATGGSDNHWLSTTAAQGAGQPTTWVEVEEKSVDGVIDGIRAGRTFVSHQPPGLGGPEAFLEADRDRDGTFESRVGDTVPRDARLRVRVKDALGAKLELITNGGERVGDPIDVLSPDFTHEFDAPAGATWVHAKAYGEDAQEIRRQLPCATIFNPENPLAEGTTYCENRIAMLALTSALFLRDPDPEEPAVEAPAPPSPEPAAVAQTPPPATEAPPAATPAPRATAPAKAKAKQKAKKTKTKRKKRRAKRRSR